MSFSLGYFKKKIKHWQFQKLIFPGFLFHFPSYLVTALLGPKGLKSTKMNALFFFHQVNIRVSVVDGVVHVNNSKAIHAAVTTFHFFAEIGKITSYS